MTEYSKYEFNFYDIYYGFYRFTIKTHDNKIYSIGNNASGDCGVGTTSTISSLTEIDTKNIKLNENGNNFISCISKGGNTMFMCINDNIYGNGTNNRSQIGSNSFEPEISSPIEIKFPFDDTKIIQIECGYSHCLFLDDKGKLFARGGNAYCQCGMDSDGLDVAVTTPIECQAFIKEIDCGAYANLCLSDKNELWVFGNNINNECGIYKKENGKKLRTVPPTLHCYFKKKNIEIIYIGTKDHHSLCIDSENRVYLFGQNQHHQICKMLKPDKITEFVVEYPSFKDYKFIQGSCGNEHTLLLSDDNKVVGIGSNSFKQTNPGSHLDVTIEPHIFTFEQIGMKAGQQILKVLAADDTTLIICDFC